MVHLLFSGLDPTFAQSVSPIFSRSIIILTFVTREMSQFRFLPDTANYRGIGGESVIRDGSAKFWQKGGRGEMTGDRRWAVFVSRISSESPNWEGWLANEGVSGPVRTPAESQDNSRAKTTLISSSLYANALLMKKCYCEGWELTKKDLKCDEHFAYHFLSQI